MKYVSAVAHVTENRVVPRIRFVPFGKVQKGLFGVLNEKKGGCCYETVAKRK